jgi:hypothetical protein
MLKAWHKNFILHFFRFKILSSFAHIWCLNEQKHFSSFLVQILCLVGRASRYIRLTKNQLDAQYIFSIFRQTSTCFRSNYGPSSGGTPYACNSWYLLFCLDDCLLLYAYGVPPDEGPELRPKHVEVRRNILKINCASRWFFFTRILLSPIN